MSEVKPFLLFPVSLLRELFTNQKETLRNILHVGVMNCATKIEPTGFEVAHKIMYEYLHNTLPFQLTDRIDQYRQADKFYLISDETKEFDTDGTTFDPDYEMRQLEDRIWLEDKEFYSEALLYWQIHRALHMVGVTSGDIVHLIDNANMILDSTHGQPLAMMHKDVMFNYRDHYKTDDELMQLAFNVAIRSIVGKKGYSKTNRLHILSRAFGYSSVKDLPKKFKSDRINEIFKKYSTRYYFDKIIEQLKLNWGIVTYSNHMRGMYVGIKSKIGKKELAELAEKKKDSTRIRLLRQEEAMIKKQAIESVMGKPKVKSQSNGKCIPIKRTDLNFFTKQQQRL